MRNALGIVWCFAGAVFASVCVDMGAFMWRWLTIPVGFAAAISFLIKDIADADRKTLERNRESERLQERIARGLSREEQLMLDEYRRALPPKATP